MQMGFDFNVVVSTSMISMPQLEEQLDELSEKIRTEVWHWFNTTEEIYSLDHKRSTVIRFCLTAGIGAAWFWTKHKEDVEKQGLYNCLTAPRDLFEMDEYIEDVVGIWFDSLSSQHQLLAKINNNCMGIIMRHYDIDDPEQEKEACSVIIRFGACYGHTIITRNVLLGDYKGDMSSILRAWTGLNDSNDPQWAEHQTVKGYVEGPEMRTATVYLNDEHSEFAKIEKEYCHSSYNESAGIKIIGQWKDGAMYLKTGTPIFKVKQRHTMVIDEVQPWPDGTQATIVAHFYNDPGCHVTFYDTHYLENKEKYYAHVAYAFELYGMVNTIEVVPEEKRTIQLKGESAVNFNKKFKNETHYDAGGNPEPVEINLKNMHYFIQINDEYPEGVEFHSPIHKVYNNVDFLGKDIQVMDIELHYHDEEVNARQHIIPIFISPGTQSNIPQDIETGEPVRGTMILQGRMVSMITPTERPSSILHTFDARHSDGTPMTFTHDCDDDNENQTIMTADERHKFAVKIFHDYMLRREHLTRQGDFNIENGPDLLLERSRCAWIKDDADNCAAQNFARLNDLDNYMIYAHSMDCFPMIVYVTLSNLDGAPCPWIKGGTYHARFHYGSVYPGQKMEATFQMSHNQLLDILFHSCDKLDNRFIEPYIHKDIDFRSPALCDPIICRDDFLKRNEVINQNNRKAPEGRMKPELCHDNDGNAYILLHYPEGDVDQMNVTTHNGFITAINIVETSPQRPES